MIGPVVTRGFGTFGTASLVITAGYSAGSPPPPPPAERVGGGPGWMLFYTEEVRDKRWKKQRKSEDQLRTILEKAVAKALGRDDRRAESIVADHSDRKTDTDATPSVVAAAVDYSSLLRDISACEYLLGVYYQKRVQIENDEDEEFLLLSI